MHAQDGWLNNEYVRISEVSKSLKIPKSVLNRLYVANRGLINLDSNHGFSEEHDSGKGLMRFYMHILNFLIRENRRREPAPYIDYAGRLTKGWVKL